MSLTGRLGSSESYLGNIQLGVAAEIHEVSNVLSLSQTLGLNKVLNLTPSNSVTFSESQNALSSQKAVSDALTLVQSAGTDFVFDRDLNDSVSFVSVLNSQHLRIASNTITFADSASSLTYNGTYGALTFSQTVGINADYVLNSNFSILALAQTVTTATTRSLAISNTITVAQTVSAARVKSFNVSSVLFPHHTLVHFKTLGIIQSVTFSHAVTVNNVFNRSVGNTLLLTDTMSRNAVYDRGFSDAFSPVNGQFRPVNLQATQGHTYVPSILDPAQVATFQYVTIPGAMITKVDGYVSFATPGYVLYLKQPDFGDSEGNLHKVVEHRTVSGKLYTHVRRQPGRALKYRFEISRAKAEETRWFMMNFLSTPMLLTNWKGEIWYGYITNNPFNIESKRRSVPCNVEDYEVNVEFEGVRIH